MKTLTSILLTLLVGFVETNAQTNFTLVDSPVIRDIFGSCGVAWIDYDNDGYVDLFVANFEGNNYLFHNQRDGTFVSVTDGPEVNEGANESYGVAWGDYNNDGFPDLFVGNGYATGKANFLYLNDGKGSFIKVTNGPIVSVAGYFSGCSWADFDRDGLIDLFVANDPVDSPPVGSGTSLLFRNSGNGTFTQTNVAAAVASHALVGGWADFDNDGWPDLFVANGFSSGPTPNFLYRNLGNGSFARVLSPNFVSASGSSVCAAWGDYDNDGFLDGFVSNYGQRNELYHNDENGTFTRVTTGNIYTDLSGSISASWGDYDNDGWLDLFVGNRNASDGTPTRGFLYHNNGNGTFTKITTGPIAEYSIRTGGCGWGDYDNDGFLDLFVSHLGDPGLSASALFHNTGNSNHWLKVKCVGTASNRMAIGAKVRVKATIFGKSFWQLREITSGDGFGNAAFIAHFGLGDATNVDTVRIEWPSGTVQEMSNVPAQQFVNVTEPAALKAQTILPGNSFQLSLTGGIGFHYDIETSSDLATWKTWTSLTCTNRTVALTDTNVITSSNRFYRAVMR